MSPHKYINSTSKGLNVKEVEHNSLSNNNSAFQQKAIKCPIVNY